jgi:hypothetical protein
MSPPTVEQQRRRARFEAVIGLAAPALDLLLAVGDRVSRLVGRDDDYIPIRSPEERLELETRRDRQVGRRSPSP